MSRRAMTIVVLALLGMAMAPAVARASTYAVNITTDAVDANPGDNVCATAASACTLRAAVMEANAHAGADTISVPPGTYQLTIAGNDANQTTGNAAVGDLDVTSGPITIQSTSGDPTNTIIEAGTNATNGIDHIFSFNSIATTAPTGFGVTVTGLTLRFGRNPGHLSDADGGWGGAFDWDAGADGSGSLTMSRDIVSDNQTTDADGGGIALFDGGTVSIDHTTFANNTANTAGATAWTGGAVFVGSSGHNTTFTFTNDTVSGNSAQSTGGGMMAFGTFGSGIDATTIQNSTFTGNTAKGGTAGNSGEGGGLDLIDGSYAISGSTIANNTATLRGGGVAISNATSAPASSISTSTISGNAASGAGSTLGGGVFASGGNVSLSFDRIVANSAGSGNGLLKDNNPGTATAQDDWWGCNAGPSGGAGCDQAVKTAVGSGGGALTLTKWLQLHVSASPAAINTHAAPTSSAIQADFLTDSAGGAIAGSNLGVFQGLGASFASSDSTLGSVSGATAFSNGVATATFSAGSRGGVGGVDSTVDAQTTHAAITVTAEADLAVTDLAAPDPVTAGSGGGTSNLTHTITLINNGPDAADGAQVDVMTTLPSGVTLHGATPSAGTFGSGVWTVPTLPSGASRTLTLTFDVSASAPNNSTVASGVTSVPPAHTNDPFTTNNTASASTTVLQPPKFSPSPASKDFGGQLVGTTSSAETFTITNSGGEALHVSSDAITGSDAGQFDESAETCTGSAVAPGGTCTITVDFSPTRAGAITAAQVHLVGDAANSPTDIALSGTGTQPAASISPASHDFGAQLVGTSSTATTLTVTNSGTADLHVASVALAGTNPGQFALSADTCSGRTVTPGHSCTVDASFAPTSTGAKDATLRVTSDAPSSPDDIALTGTGVQPAVSVSPASHDFGNQRVATTSAATTLTVTNSGTADLHVASVALAGTNPGQFALSADTCSGQTVTPGHSCTVDASFAPTTTGAQSAVLRVASDAPSSPDDVALSGTGVEPDVSVSPASHEFGAQRPGTTSAATTFTVTNSGTDDLHVASAGLAGTDAGQFALSADTCSGQTVAPGGTCTVDVAFAPATTGAKGAALRIMSDAPSSPDDIALTGTGATPAVSVAPTSHDFGKRLVGSTSGATTFTVTNSGTDTLHVTSASLAGANPGQFTLTANGCDTTTLAPGEQCTVDAHFAPTSTGAKSAVLRIASDAASSPDDAPLSGTGVQPEVSVSPASHDFGNQLVGTTSAATTFTVTNSGSADMHVTSAALTGTSPGQFGLSSDTCSGQTVTPGQSCTVDIAFVPTSTGAKDATLRVSSDAPSSPDDIALTGTGVQPGVSVSPASHDFGHQRVATSSATTTFTVTNSGTDDLHISAIGLAGTNAGQFALSADHCLAQTVAPGSSCTVDVAFAPTSAGAKSAVLRVTSDAPSSPDDAGLSGTGVQPAVSTSPASHDFGSQRVGTTSGATTLTVTNSGSDALHVASAGLAGTDAGEFALSADQCSGQTVVPGGTCTVDVAFAPTATGAKTAALQIMSDAPSSPDDITLSGTGIEPGVSVSPASQDFGSQRVATTSGATTITVTNSGTDALHLTSASLAGTNPGQFALTANGCDGTTLAPGQQCTVDTHFAPTSTGAKSAVLRIASDAASSPDDVALSGTGVEPAVAIDPAAGHDFGTQRVGTSSSAATFTLTNTGSSALSISTVDLGGTDPGQFALSADACSGQRIAAGRSCTVDATFAPTAPGSAHAVLRVSSDASSSPDTVPLSGTGIQPAVSIDPAAGHDFGGQRVGSSSSAVTVTVTNSGTADLHVSTVDLAGTNPAQFALSADGCAGQTVNPASSSTVDVAFSPTSAGPASAALRVASDAASSPDTIPLSGTGTQPAVSIAPAAGHDYGTQRVGTTSTPVTFTVTNAGTATLNVSSVSLAGSDPGQFALGADHCSRQAVPPGQSCTLTATFAPTSTGTKSALVRVVSDAPSSPDTAPLSGSATTAGGGNGQGGNDQGGNGQGGNGQGGNGQGGNGHGGGGGGGSHGGPGGHAHLTALVAPSERLAHGWLAVGCRLDRPSLDSCMATALSAGRQVGRARVAVAHAGRRTATVRLRLGAAIRTRLAHAAGGVPLRVRLTATTRDSTRKLHRTASTTAVVPRVVLAPRFGMFVVNGATIRPAARAFLAAAARQIGTAKRVICTGYTSGRGFNSIAKQLSHARAETACAFLRRHGVRAPLLARGRAGHNPIASNATLDGQQRNRRVTLTIER